MTRLLTDIHWRERSTLTGVRLPDGTASGGVLTDPEAGGLLVLFADEDLNRGDKVVVAHGLVLTVTAVERGTLTGQQVTALQVRRSNPEH